MTLYFVTGGERSGKSSFAGKLALGLTDSPVYIATARIHDEDFRERIERHKAERDNRWTTIENEKSISSAEIEGKTAVVDCVTLWLTNFFEDNNYDSQKALAEAKDEFDKLMKKNSVIIMISNELGMGVHASDHSTRKFIEMHGWMNQHIANRADYVYLMISGIPVKIKG